MSDRFGPAGKVGPNILKSLYPARQPPQPRTRLAPPFPSLSTPSHSISPRWLILASPQLPPPLLPTGILYLHACNRLIEATYPPRHSPDRWTRLSEVISPALRSILAARDIMDEVFHPHDLGRRHPSARAVADLKSLIYHL
jgi:hypothetical protein